MLIRENVRCYFIFFGPKGKKNYKLDIIFLLHQFFLFYLKKSKQFHSWFQFSSQTNDSLLIFYPGTLFLFPQEWEWFRCELTRQLYIYIYRPSSIPIRISKTSRRGGGGLGGCGIILITLWKITHFLLSQNKFIREVVKGFWFTNGK